VLLEHARARTTGYVASEAANIQPNIALTANDAGVIKIYAGPGYARTITCAVTLTIFIGLFAPHLTREVVAEAMHVSPLPEQMLGL